MPLIRRTHDTMVLHGIGLVSGEEHGEGAADEERGDSGECFVECTVFGRQEIEVDYYIVSQHSHSQRARSGRRISVSTDNAMVTASVSSVSQPVESTQVVVRVVLEVGGGRFVNGQRCRLRVGDSRAGPAKC